MGIPSNIEASTDVYQSWMRGVADIGGKSLRIFGRHGCVDPDHREPHFHSVRHARVDSPAPWPVRRHLKTLIFQA